jgi:hypothetical protein
MYEFWNALCTVFLASLAAAVMYIEGKECGFTKHGLSMIFFVPILFTVGALYTEGFNSRSMWGIAATGLVFESLAYVVAIRRRTAATKNQSEISNS